MNGIEWKTLLYNNVYVVCEFENGEAYSCYFDAGMGIIFGDADFVSIIDLLSLRRFQV